LLKEPEPMKRRMFLHVVLACVLLTALPTVFYAQFTSPFAPPLDAMDTLSEGSAGPSAGPYMDRAQSASDAAAAQPQPRARVDEYDDYDYGSGPGPAQPTTPTPTPIPVTRVLTGERVSDHISRQILSDIRYVYVPKDEVEGNYFDDGTHGDEEADNLLYTNISERDDVIGAETHKILARLLVALTKSEELNPLEFFRLQVLTTETISEIGNWREEEGVRDKWIREWAIRFVREYRINPDDMTSPFLPLYVVPPPPPPSLRVPTPVDNAWLPPTSPLRKSSNFEDGEAGEGRGRDFETGDDYGY
jgi:hypothetical protein